MIVYKCMQNRLNYQLTLSCFAIKMFSPLADVILSHLGGPSLCTKPADTPLWLISVCTFSLPLLQFKIQFDDSLTSTFEYPSETSLLETNGFDASAVAVAAADRTLDVEPNNAGAGGGGGGGFPDNGLLSHKNTLLSSMPLGKSRPESDWTVRVH